MKLCYLAFVVICMLALFLTIYRLYPLSLLESQYFSFNASVLHPKINISRFEQDSQRLQDLFERSQSSCEGKVVYEFKNHPYAHFSVVHVITDNFLEAVAGGYYFDLPPSIKSEYISKKTM